MANLSTFYETRSNFIPFVFPKNDVRSLSYEEWINIPQDYKSAALFIEFFNEILLAWDKANAYDFIPAPDGVSIVLQYLEKNVEKIKSNSKKYTPNYIYTVAYNCMYCICHDLKSVKGRWENETDRYVTTADGEFDLFETEASEGGSAEDQADQADFQKRFWAAIEDAGLPAHKVLDFILSGDAKDLKKIPSNTRNREFDPLRDIAVSLDAVEDILEDLRGKLSYLYDELVCQDEEDEVLSADDIKDSIESVFEDDEEAPLTKEDVDQIIQKVYHPKDSIWKSRTKVNFRFKAEAV